MLFLNENYLSSNNQLSIINQVKSVADDDESTNKELPEDAKEEEAANKNDQENHRDDPKCATFKK
jgi:hypothetical protein